MHAFLLDVYSRCPIAEADYRSGEPFVDTCPWFDRDYVFRTRLFGRLGSLVWPRTDVIGGPRLRCFYYEGPSQLRELGLIRSSPGLDAIAESIQHVHAADPISALEEVGV